MFDLSHFQSILSGLGAAAAQVTSAGVGGQQDAKHVATANAILQLLGLVLSSHPAAPQPQLPVPTLPIRTTPVSFGINGDDGSNAATLQSPLPAATR